MAFVKLKSLFELEERTWHRGLDNNRTQLLGAIVGLLGWVFLEVRKAEPHLLVDYGITITKPAKDAKLGQKEVEVKGTYKEEAPEGTLRLFTMRGNRIWPQETVWTFDRDKKEWAGRVWLGGDPPYPITIVAAIVGQSTLVLWDYERRVRQQCDPKPNFRYPPIEGLPRDLIKQCEVHVERVAAVPTASP